MVFIAMISITTSLFYVAAAAFIRYALVCHPTKKSLVSNKLLWLIVAATLIIAILSVASNLLLIFWDHITLSPDSDVIADIKVALINCDLLYSRSTARVTADLILCLLLPAAISGFFYINVGIQLLKRERDPRFWKKLTISESCILKLHFTFFI